MDGRMIVEICDDFSIEKIINSGQCFRPKMLPDGSGFFITGSKCLKIKELCEGKYDVSCSAQDWHETWFDYFDLKRSYSAIRAACAGRNSYIDEAMEYSKGIRILRQNPWEMLISFIVSQRKSIPAIRKTIEYFSERFGSPIANEVFKAFPTPKQLSMATDAELKESGLGYRMPFIVDATRRVLDGDVDLSALFSIGDEQLVEQLKSFRGVGIKVANCVALFAYARTGLAPVDVWIQRTIDEHFAGVNIFPEYGDSAGIMQQYVFYRRLC